MIAGLPDLLGKLNDQFKTQAEWSKAAENMAKIVKNIADKHHKEKGDVWDEGGAARAALHAIAGGLLGGAGGVDVAIKGAIGAGVSTIIAPYIRGIVDDAIAQSGLTGEDAKRLSDTLTSSIVLGLLAGAGGTDAAAYAGNELKYNFLSSDKKKKQIDLRNKLKNCLSNKIIFSEQEIKSLSVQNNEIDMEDFANNYEIIEYCKVAPPGHCTREIVRIYKSQILQIWRNLDINDPNYDELNKYGSASFSILRQLLTADDWGNNGTGRITDAMGAELLTAGYGAMLGASLGIGSILAASTPAATAAAYNCFTNPFCRAEAGYAIAEGMMGEALGGSSLVVGGVGATAGMKSAQEMAEILAKTSLNYSAVKSGTEIIEGGIVRLTGNITTKDGKTLAAGSYARLNGDELTILSSDGKTIYKGAYSKLLDRPSLPAPQVPGGGLQAHEAAHLIQRHVGKTEADLAARLVAEPKIIAASSFTNQNVAEIAVRDAIKANQNFIDDFLKGKKIK